MRVTVQQLTFEEFAEAVAAIQRVAAEKQKRRARRSPMPIVFGIAIGLVLVGAVTDLWARFDPTPQVRPRAYTIIAFGVPFLGMLVFASVLAAAQQSSLSPGSFAKRLLVLMLPMFGIVVVLAGLYALTKYAPQPPGQLAGAPPGPRDWYGTLVPHVAWMFLVVLGAVVGARAIRGQIRQSWEAAPSVMRMKTFDITAAGVHVDERVTQRTYEWPALVRFVETANLLLLCPSEITFEILPKRAFASADDLEAARALFATQISPPGARPAAFPVLPAGART